MNGKNGIEKILDQLDDWMNFAAFCPKPNILYLVELKTDSTSISEKQLVSKEDRSKDNKVSGLELEVEDGDTGKPCPVVYLSGDESFMAALAFALACPMLSSHSLEILSWTPCLSTKALEA